MSTDTPQRGDAQAFNGSISLPDLAARIRTYHEATVAAIRTSVMHAMAADDLLIAAKSRLKHGQWLPWLAEHCAMPERTAQWGGPVEMFPPSRQDLTDLIIGRIKWLRAI